jgi:hypothetical protein
MPLEQTATVLHDSSDVEVGTAGNPLRVDPTGTTPQPVTGTVTANQGTPAAVADAWPILVTDGVDTAEIVDSAPGAGAFGLVVRIAGSIAVALSQPTTGTTTSVALSDVVATILAANAARLGAILFNDGGSAAFVRLAAGATLALFTVRMANNATWELQTPVYTGQITGITDAGGAATMLATELTV